MVRQRYLDDESTARALAILTQGGLPGAALDRIAYLFAAQADRLLHDVVTDLLAVPGRAAEVSAVEVQRFIQDLTRNAAGRQLWSAETALRIARGLLSSLRDFGILKGTARKRLAMPYLPLEAIAFVAFALSRTEGRAGGLVQSAEWRLFLLQPVVVERLFIEAQGHHLLTYHAAGSVIRVDFNVPGDEGLVGDASAPVRAASAAYTMEACARALARGCEARDYVPSRSWCLMFGRLPSRPKRIANLQQPPTVRMPKKIRLSSMRCRFGMTRETG